MHSVPVKAIHLQTGPTSSSQDLPPNSSFKYEAVSEQEIQMDESMKEQNPHDPVPSLTVATNWEPGLQHLSWLEGPSYPNNNRCVYNSIFRLTACDGLKIK